MFGRRVLIATLGQLSVILNYLTVRCYLRGGQMVASQDSPSLFRHVLVVDLICSS